MRCKQLILIATLVVFSFSLVSGQAVYIDLDEVDGLNSNNWITPDVAVDLIIPVHFTNASAELYCISNGFDFVSGNVTFDPIDTVGLQTWNPDYPWNMTYAIAIWIAGGMVTPMPTPADCYFDMMLDVNLFDNGIGFAGITGTGLGLPGPPVGFDDVACYITVPNVLGADSNYVLTMDSTYWAPSNIWVWCNPGDVECAWGGPYEFLVFPPNDVDFAGGGALPTVFSLRQNYPNPFNPTTEVHFDVPSRSSVKIEVYNVLGRKVKTLVDEEMAAGSYVRTWDGTSNSGNAISSGVYLYKMEAGSFVETKKMMMLK